MRLKINIMRNTRVYFKMSKKLNLNKDLVMKAGA